MQRLVRLVIALIVLAGALGIAASARGDGKFLPSASAIVRDPAMPSQAAVIGHHDALETLIIESGVESDGTPLAWVVPVPAEPEVIAAVSPGTVATALEIASPRVIDAAAARRDMSSALTALVVALAVGAIFRMAIARGLWTLVAAVALLFAIVALLLPALASARGFPPAGGVSVVRSVSAGRYEVDVVKAAVAEDLVRWLTERGFDLPAAVRPAIDAYIAKGWLFCAARVVLEKGHVAPHPLKLIFPSREIVYPMSLTAAGGGELDLDLVVFASGPVSHPLLQVWSASVASPVLPKDPEEFWGYGRRGRVGHPELMPLALEGSWMTRLHGHLDLRRDRDDLTLPIGPARAVSTRLATWSDVRMVFAQTFVWTAALLMLSVLPFAGHGPTKPHLHRAALLFVVVSVVAGAAMAAAQLSGLTLATFGRLEGPRPHVLSALRGFGVEANASTNRPEAVRAELAERLSFIDDEGHASSREGLELPYGWRVESDAEGRTVVTIIEPSGRPMSMTMGEGIWRPAVVRERPHTPAEPVAEPPSRP